MRWRVEVMMAGVTEVGVVVGLEVEVWIEVRAGAEARAVKIADGAVVIPHFMTVLGISLAVGHDLGRGRLHPTVHGIVVFHLIVWKPTRLPNKSRMNPLYY